MTFDEHVQELESLFHNGGVPGPYLFVPESFGSLLTIDYARQHAGETAGIVFLDGVDPQLWFPAIKEQNGWDADAKNALFGAGWRIGVVRLAFTELAPPWVKDLPPSILGEMRAIYSRPAAGFDEAIQAYRRSSPDHRPVLTPQMLGWRPVIAIQRGKTSDALSSRFRSGWAESQRRLVGMSREGRMVVAEGADHEVAQEAPDLAARYVREAVDAIRRHP